MLGQLRTWTRIGAALLGLGAGIFAGASGASAQALPQPSIQIVKTAPSTVPAGSAGFSYTITVFNSGNGISNPLLITDPLPPEVSLVGVTTNAPTSVSCNDDGGGSITCGADPLAGGGSYTITVNVSLGEGAVAGTSFTNTATVDNQIIASNTDAIFDPGLPRSSSAAVAVVGPDLIIQKTHVGNGVRGQPLTYTILITNQGVGGTTGATTMTESPPADVIPSSITGGGNWTCTFGPPIRCTNPDLLAGGGALFPPITFVVDVQQTAPNSILNQVLVDTPNDINLGNNSDDDTAAIAAPPVDVGVTKTGPASVTAGDEIIYTINVSNSVGGTASGLTLTDPLPANVVFTGLTTPAGWACSTPAAGTNGTITCTLASLGSGVTSGPFLLVGQVATSATGQLINTATIATTSTDTNAANNTATATTAIVAPPPPATSDVSVTKSGPASVVAGSAIAYTVNVSNAGPAAATGLSLSDPLPANVTFTSLTAPAGWACTTPVVGTSGTIVCTNATLGAGAAAGPFIINGQVAGSATAALTNTATIVTTSTDTNPGNNTASATTTITVPPPTTSDVGVTKSGPASVVAGSAITYALNVTNAGPAVATGLVLTDPLPPGVTFASIAAPAGWACTTPAVGTNGTITCISVGLGAGASAGPFTLTGRVAPGTVGPLVNTTMVSSTSTDTNPANNTASATTTVSNPSFQLSLSLGFSTPTYYAAGEVVQVRYLVGNPGTSTVTGIVTTDPKVPVITCPATSLAPTASMTCTGPYTITPADITTGSSAFAATVTGSGGASAAATGTITSVTGLIQTTFTTLAQDFVATRSELLDIDPPGLHDRNNALTGSLSESNGDPTLNFAASYVGGAGQAAGDLATGVVKPPFKIWIDGKLTLHSRNNGSGGLGQLGLGGDYLVTDDLLLGAALYIDWMSDTAKLGSVSGNGYLVGPYISAAIGPHLSVDAGLFVGGSHNTANSTISGTAFSGTFDTTRVVARAKLDGLWELEALTIRPDATLFLTSENAGAYSVRDALGNAVSVAGFTVRTLDVSGGALFEKPIELEDGLLFVPQAGFRLGISGSGGNFAFDDPYGSVSAGFMLQGDHWKYESRVQAGLWASSLKDASWKGRLSGEF